MDIVERLQRIRERIDAAAQRAGQVRLIAVSKRQPVEAIRAAMAAGQCAFGESTVQEAVDKIDALADEALEWHFVGHLQSRKARFLPGRFQWLHSLDSLKLAERLSAAILKQHAAAPSVSDLNVLIQVNVARDPAKHGVPEEDLPPLLEALLAAELPGIRLRGLMTIGRRDANETEARRCFARLYELRERCARDFDLPDFTELSMGMSRDFEAAIREGATMVRIGTGVFGVRSEG